MNNKKRAVLVGALLLVVVLGGSGLLQGYVETFAQEKHAAILESWEGEQYESAYSHYLALQKWKQWEPVRQVLYQLPTQSYYEAMALMDASYQNLLEQNAQQQALKCDTLLSCVEKNIALEWALQDEAYWESQAQNPLTAKAKPILAQLKEDATHSKEALKIHLAQSTSTQSALYQTMAGPYSFWEEMDLVGVLEPSEVTSSTARFVIEIENPSTLTVFSAIEFAGAPNEHRLEVKDDKGNVLNAQCSQRVDDYQRVQPCYTIQEGMPGKIVIEVTTGNRDNGWMLLTLLTPQS